MPRRPLVGNKFFSLDSIPAKPKVHCEPLRTGRGGLDNSVRLTVEMGDTSKGKYFVLGPSSGKFDFSRDGVDFSEESDFNESVSGLSEEFILN